MLVGMGLRCPRGCGRWELDTVGVILGYYGRRGFWGALIWLKDGSPFGRKYFLRNMILDILTPKCLLP